MSRPEHSNSEPLRRMDTLHAYGDPTFSTIAADLHYPPVATLLPILSPGRLVTRMEFADLTCQSNKSIDIVRRKFAITAGIFESLGIGGLSSNGLEIVIFDDEDSGLEEYKNLHTIFDSLREPLLRPTGLMRRGDNIPHWYQSGFWVLDSIIQDSTPFRERVESLKSRAEKPSTIRTALMMHLRTMRNQGIVTYMGESKLPIGDEFNLRYDLDALEIHPDYVDDVARILGVKRQFEEDLDRIDLSYLSDH